MPRPSALAFGAPGFLATVHEIDDRTQTGTPPDFMGPTLWTSDVDEFEAGHASHYDMLHNSPNAVGIAWESGNAYWVYDGYHRSITRYDFGLDHGPGGEDHSDGVIARYVEGQVGYVEQVGAHMEMDRATGLLYVADPANVRVAVLDTRTGTRGAIIGPNYDGADMYAVDGAALTTLIDGNAHGLVRPSGIAIHGGVLYVSDASTSRIAAFDLTGAPIDWIDLSSQIAPGQMGGIELDAEGRIYVCEFEANRVLRVSARAL
jgi:sugar lactone lactonase YvrE